MRNQILWIILILMLIVGIPRLAMEDPPLMQSIQPSAIDFSDLVNK